VNQNQALIPQGAKALANLWGVAPGIYLEDKDFLFVALPGVPVEMKWMLDNEVLPILRTKKPQHFILHRKFRTTGISESAIYEKIEQLIDPTGELKVAFLPEHLGVNIRLTVKSGDKDQAQGRMDQFEEKLRGILGDRIYGMDDQTLEAVVGRLLLDGKKTIATAESCTGGLIATRLTNVPGSSGYFERGVVSYSNQAKVELLGVPAEMIEKQGAVSEQVAVSMAQGVRKLAGADYGLSATGIAGPGGGTPQKPVGLVYVGFVDKNQSFAQRFVFGEDRKTNREKTAQAALNLVRLCLIKPTNA
jgi:nicotinamide-nucleotide amidase